MSLQSFATREYLLFTRSIYRSLRCASSMIKTQNARPQHPKKSSQFRIPVAFGLAEYIHAPMLERLKRQYPFTEGALSHSKFGATENQNNLNEKEWKKELEELSMEIKKVRIKDYATSKNVSLLEETYRKRIKEVGLPKSLQVADVFFSHKYRQGNFLSSLFNYATQKGPKCLPAPIVTHLMFYVFFHGSAPHHLFYQLEDYLADHLDQFDVNDIGIICLGYFRGNKRIISHDLLNQFSERVLRDFGQLEEDMLINILKTFRQSGFAKQSFFESLAKKLIESSWLERTSLNNLMHISMTYACSSMCYKQLNQELLSCFVKLVQKYQGAAYQKVQKHQRKVHLRSKDIAKFVWALGTFVHEPEEQKSSYQKLVEAYCNVSRKQEQEHPESLADILQGLTYLGIHCPELIGRVMQPVTATSLKDSKIYGKAFQLQLFYYTVLIECPEYKGTLPSENFMRSVQKQPGNTGDLGFEMKTRQGLREIARSLQDMLGPNKVKVHFILPHFTLSDIEMRLDENNQPTEFTATSITPERSNIPAAGTDPLGSTQTRKVAVEILGHNQYFANTKELTGNIQTKLRQLRILGYHVLLIVPDDAKRLSVMTEEDRKHYLCQRLHQELGLDVQI